jgi:hypothetical protein
LLPSLTDVHENFTALQRIFVHCSGHGVFTPSTACHGPLTRPDAPPVSPPARTPAPTALPFTLPCKSLGAPRPAKHAARVSALTPSPLRDRGSRLGVAGDPKPPASAPSPGDGPARRRRLPSGPHPSWKVYAAGEGRGMDAAAAASLGQVPAARLASKCHLGPPRSLASLSGPCQPGAPMLRTWAAVCSMGALLPDLLP